jgi:O-succinylbenzoic acid--CoA ligase
LDDSRDDEGWFHTGDVGRFEADGSLVVTGRKDNMFVSGGENIYPEEIEVTLCSLPQIEQAVVVPVLDDEFGQRPVAFIRFLSGEQMRCDAVLTHLGESLPHFKLPVRLYRWPEDQPVHSFKPDRTFFEALALRPEADPLS